MPPPKPPVGTYDNVGLSIFEAVVCFSKAFLIPMADLRFGDLPGPLEVGILTAWVLICQALITKTPYRTFDGAKEKKMGTSCQRLNSMCVCR